MAQDGGFSKGTGVCRESDDTQRQPDLSLFKKDILPQSLSPSSHSLGVTAQHKNRESKRRRAVKVEEEDLAWEKKKKTGDNFLHEGWAWLAMCLLQTYEDLSFFGFPSTHFGGKKSQALQCNLSVRMESAEVWGFE